MTDHEHGDDLPDDLIRESLRATGDRPTPEFAAVLRATLAEAAAGYTTAPVTPVAPRTARWRPFLAAAAAIVLIAGTVAVLGARDGDGEVATVTPATSAPTEATAPNRTADHATAVRLREWVGVRLNGLGNGAVNGEYPWFVIQSIDVETGAIRMTGNDGCNAWSSRGTIVDDRFEYLDGEAQGQECGPGTFELRTGDAFLVRDDGIDIERGGVVYPFGPDPVEADAATTIDRRRFIETSGERPFPFSVSFDGTEVSGFDGCGIFGATAVYTRTSVLLLDVESQCSTEVTPLDGDVIEHGGSNTIRVQRDSATVIDSLVSVSESFVGPSTDWLLGDWAVGWGRVTIEESRATLGSCDTPWLTSDELVIITPWDDCTTGLFPGDPRAEANLRTVLEAPVVHRIFPPTEGSEPASILDSGSRAVRLVRIESLESSSPTRLFALTTIDGAPFDGDRPPTVAVLGTQSGVLARGTDGCGDFSITGTRAGSSVTIDSVTTSTPCAPTDGRRFLPGSGTTLTADGSELTATDEAGRTGRYAEITALDEALVSDLLDPITGTGAWSLDGATVELTGPPGVGPLRVGSCELSWSFGLDDDPTPGFGSLVVDGSPDPITGCVEPDRGHAAAGLVDLLARTSSGTGAEIRLMDSDTAYLVWDVQVVRLSRVGPVEPSPDEAALVGQLVGRTWVGVDGPWRTTSPTLLFDSLDRDPGLLGVVVDTGCNRGAGTFRLDGDRMVASEVVVEEAGCDHEVAHLTDGTMLSVDGGVLTVRSTVGVDISTAYVALDSLDAVRSPDLSGEWLANGTPIAIDGTDVTASPDAPVEVVMALRGTLDVVRHGSGWIVRSASGTVQLVSP